jgi:HAD superfamily hydrolase (TIGR01549 family)
MIRCVIFDVGDTLIHYEPTAEAIIMKRLKRLGFDIDAARAKAINRQVERWIGDQIQREQQGAPRMADDAFGDNIDRVILSGFVSASEARYSALFAELRRSRGAHKQQKIVDAEVFPLLDALQSRYKLGIVSNYAASMLDYLEEAGLSRYFDAIVISEIVGCEKPDPRIMEIACERLQCRPAECLYVGDHPYDVLCAKRAGMAMAWLCEDGAALPGDLGVRADYVVANLKGVLGCLG